MRTAMVLDGTTGARERAIRSRWRWCLIHVEVVRGSLGCLVSWSVYGRNELRGLSCFGYPLLEMLTNRLLCSLAPCMAVNWKGFVVRGEMSRQDYSDTIQYMPILINRRRLLEAVPYHGMKKDEFWILRSSKISPFFGPYLVSPFLFDSFNSGLLRTEQSRDDASDARGISAP